MTFLSSFILSYTYFITINYPISSYFIDLHIFYHNLNHLYTLAFPHLRTLRLPDLQIQTRPQDSLKVYPIEQYRGILFSEDSHFGEDNHIVDNLLDECVFTNSSLCNSIFAMLVLPFVSRTRVIDIRSRDRNK